MKNKSAISPSAILPATAVNYHLLQPCNMKCKYCFATFEDVKMEVLQKGMLSENESIEVVKRLCEAGAEKITFAGGEPTLCKWLPKLIRVAKEYGATTMIVTNGSRLTDEWLTEVNGILDWITISIDSLNPATNAEIGRFTKVQGKPWDYAGYMQLIDRCRALGFRLKINTVVCQPNWKEDMRSFILEAKPERWKIFQALRVQGQNDAHFDEMTVSEVQFQHFLSQHASLAGAVSMVPEDNVTMRGSYLMVDPAGRFYDSTQGMHSYSKSILEVGVAQALQAISFDLSKYEGRDGNWNWDNSFGTPETTG